MMSLPAVLLMLDKVAEDQRVWAMLVSIGFAVSVLIQPRWWEIEDSKFVVTMSGIQLRRSDGSRLGLLWSEIAYVQVRPWLQAVDIVGHNHANRFRIWNTLEGFPRFMELIVGNLKRMEDVA